MMHCSLLDMH